MLKLRAYAKINLGLRIVRKRGDGYHDIETFFHRVLPFDEVTLEPADAIVMHTSNPALPIDSRNLCIRAAQLISDEHARGRGARITLGKNIPIGAGLGGGSSDAAATVLGLNRLWELNLPTERLHELALRLGSDVPYFLRGGSAYATGRGEQLGYAPLDLPYWVVLVYPNIHIATAWAFQNTSVALTQPAASLKDVVLSGVANPELLCRSLTNDFEPLVFHTHPAIAQLKERLEALGADLALLSGSGSSVFGLFSDEGDAGNAARILEQDFSVYVTPPNFNTGGSDIPV